MKTIKLKKLIINNFKGIKCFEIDFADNTFILGRNATGKTSVVDAYMWLLFNKNSEEQKEFGIKPYGSKNVEVSVVGVFVIDNSETKLQKVLKEKWSRRRGSDYEELIGHETETYIDDVSVSVTKYNEFVQKIFGSDDEAKIISNPLYFQNLNWKIRREILLRQIDITLIDSELRNKFKIPEGDINNIREQLRKQKTEIKQKIQEYPIRISELENRIIQIDQGVEQINEQIKEKETKLKQIEAQINTINQRNEELLSEYKNQLNRRNEIEMRLHELKTKKEQAIKTNEINRLNAEKQKVLIISEIARLEEQIKQLNIELDELRLKYSEENQKEFLPSVDKHICFNCGQQLPIGMIEKINNESKEKFLSEKSKKLEQIKAQGLSVRQQIEFVQSRISELKNATPSDYKLIDETQFDAEIAKLDYELNTIELPDVKTISTEEIENERKKIYEEIKNLNEKLQIHKMNNDIVCRINELKEQWSKQGNRLSKIEKQEIAIESYEIAFANEVQHLLNENIGIDKLQIITYRKLLNGSIEPACEIYYDGVLYNDINHAAKITVGLKLIEYLSNCFQKSMPVLVDNAEAINVLPKISSQLITLYVTEDEKLIVKH